MDKVRKPSNSVCYTPSSEPYRIEICVGTEWQNMEVMMQDRSSLTLYNRLKADSRRKHIQNHVHGKQGGE
jgi:hypothetical protein